MRQFCFLLLLAVFIACTPEKGVDFQEHSFDQVLSMAKNQDKMVLVDFWSDG